MPNTQDRLKVIVRVQVKKTGSAKKVMMLRDSVTVTGHGVDVSAQAAVAAADLLRQMRTEVKPAVEEDHDSRSG